MQLSDLIKKVKDVNKKANTGLIKRSYKFAEEHHEGQRRVTGELYIQHPLAVAAMLAELKMDEAAIAAGLLHDTIEDTEATLPDILEHFGKEVATLVDGVTKIKRLKNMSREEYQAKKLQKVILASIKDIRIILIKLADRAHNMESISVFREDKRKRISRDAMEIYAPIAHKLGVATLKWRLEDLAFEFLYPKAYKEITGYIKQSHRQRHREINKITNILNKALAEKKIKVDVQGRTKHLYSIYRKMEKKKKSFEEIYDLAAVRVITKEVGQCYEVLGVVHNVWTPLPREFEDYIATPKSNLYQSLHTVVIGPNEKPIEIQIRTEDMHEVAEKGVAAHSSYKGHGAGRDFDQKVGWMMELNDLQKESENARDFLKMLHIDFFEEEMFTFTPKGRVIELPTEATLLDFAYAIHSEVGDRAIAGRVNGKFVPIRAVLKNGDLVEVLTSKKQHPSRDWLRIVRTSKAASKIKHYIRETQKVPVKSRAKVQEVKKELEAWIIDVDQMIRPEIKFSKCCRPLPGDDIVGFATRTEKVTIHKRECLIGKKWKGGGNRKKVNVRWLDNIGSIVEIKVDASERTGLFPEILNTLISLNTPIKAANAKPLTGELIECSFEMETTDLAHLQGVIQRVKRIRGVRNVFIGNILR